MHTDAFKGKAYDYATSRPSYPEDAIDYIRSLYQTGKLRNRFSRIR